MKRLLPTVKNIGVGASQLVIMRIEPRTIPSDLVPLVAVSILDSAIGLVDLLLRVDHIAEPAKQPNQENSKSCQPDNDHVADDCGHRAIVIGHIPQAGQKNSTQKKTSQTDIAHATPSRNRTGSLPVSSSI